MKIACRNTEHLNKPVTWLCIKPECKNMRFLCSMCTSEHEACADNLLRIEDLMKAKQADNLNMISDPSIKEAVSLLQEHGIFENHDLPIKIFEENLNKQFDKITEDFLNKVKDTKTKILNTAKDLFLQTQVDMDTFENKLKSVYNINSFKNILEDLEIDSRDFEAANNLLTKAIQESGEKKNDLQDLKIAANSLNYSVRNFIEIDESLFREFQKNIPFQIFEGYPKVHKLLGWNPSKKSNHIALGNDNMNAKKENYSSWTTSGNTAVLGNREMSRGIHKWILEIHTEGQRVQSPQPPFHWICFGVIEAKYAKNMEDFPYRKSFSVSSLGEVFNMTEMKKLKNGYDDLVYVCNLDMEEGTFTISHEGSVLVRQSWSLKGMTLVPFAYLYRADNNVRIRGFLTA